MFFGYTGEYTGDSTELMYLRARMYSPDIGRFLTSDTWEGDTYSPMSFNRWMYVKGNPVNYTDPSGHLACKDVIPSARPLFEALGLCNPNETPSENPNTIGRAQQFEDWLYGNSTQCGIGYTPFGIVCVPITVEKTLGGHCGDKGPGALLAKNKNDDAGDNPPEDEGGTWNDELYCKNLKYDYEGLLVQQVMILAALNRTIDTMYDAQHSQDRILWNVAFAEYLQKMTKLAQLEAAMQDLLDSAIAADCDVRDWSAPISPVDPPAPPAPPSDKQ